VIINLRRVREFPKCIGQLAKTDHIDARVLSVALPSDLPELGRLNRSEIAALVGVAPFNCDSGTLHGQRKSQGGRMRLRRSLYMATVSAVRWNPALRPFYQRLRAGGKPAKVALVAAMHKLLLIL
jgi:transposase